MILVDTLLDVFSSFGEKGHKRYVYGKIVLVDFPKVSLKKIMY